MTETERKKYNYFENWIYTETEPNFLENRHFFWRHLVRIETEAASTLECSRETGSYSSS